MMKMKTISLALSLALGAGCLPAAANAQSYSPDIVQMDGESVLSFLPSEQIDLSDGGAIEFWLAPGWSVDPEYDPPVIVNIGPDGISYLISVMRDRDGLVFANNDDEDVFLIPLDDGQLHHVAINVLSDGIVVFVDGAIIGTSELLPSNVPSAGLFIGGLDIEDANRFRGAIGQLRIWDTYLTGEEILQFRMSDVLDGAEGAHPQLEALTALSNFEAGELMLVDAVEVE